jgi:hypothetical protein
MQISRSDLTPAQLRVLQGFADTKPRLFADAEICEQLKELGLLEMRLGDYHISASGRLVLVPGSGRMQ